MHFEKWMRDVPALDEPLGQLVIVTLAAQRLAAAGVDLTVVIGQLLRGYGVDASSITIDDGQSGTEMEDRVIPETVH
jgi:hypothetical protein